IGRLAVDYRYAFGSDVVIDLIGYRRHGHSEVDDPTITQPLIYKAVKDHPALWEIYADDNGIEDARQRAEAIKSELEAAQKRGTSLKKKPSMRQLPAYWSNYTGGRYKSQYEVDTA